MNPIISKDFFEKKNDGRNSKRHPWYASSSSD